MSRPIVPNVKFEVINTRKLFPTQVNSVVIIVQTRNEEISINPTTGHQTTRLIRPLSPSSFLVDFSLHSCSDHDIIGLLYDNPDIRRLLGDRSVRDIWVSLCSALASEISHCAISLGFGYNGFTLTVKVTLTYRNTVSLMNDERLFTMVQLGRMKTEDLMSLNMETEPCSICLESLVSGSKPSEATRMTCSHVFHNHCLLEWLKRQNTCPLCRTVLYHR